MDSVSTSYNISVPAEQSAGQTVAGPEVKPAEQEAPKVETEQNTQQAEASKGTQVDTTA